MDEDEKRLRDLLRRRHFVDRESGVLLVWLAADPGELAEAVGQLETRHPSARFSLLESGAALAVRMAAPDHDLADIEARYVAD